VRELPGDQVGDSDQPLRSSVTSGAGLGRLNQRIDRLDAAVGAEDVSLFWTVCSSVNDDLFSPWRTIF
jgi:hypothetical protein